MSTNDILDRTANAMAATTVFGPAHEHNGVTVIPAATVRGGGGGGGGTRTSDADEPGDTGEGGGFGLTARPAGAIVINGDTVTWKAPPVDLTRIFIAGHIVAVAYFVFAWLTARSQAKS
ncbi:MAG: spore germination protein GerW family protein [Acidimicrobiales bacterium]